MHGGVKIALLPMKIVFINVKKGMCKLSRWVAQKHTTNFSWYFSCWLWILCVCCECYLYEISLWKTKKGVIFNGVVTKH